MQVLSVWEKIGQAQQVHWFLESINAFSNQLFPLDPDVLVVRIFLVGSNAGAIRVTSDQELGQAGKHCLPCWVRIVVKGSETNAALAIEKFWRLGLRAESPLKP